MHLCRAGAYVVGERQGAPPGRRRHLSAQGGQQRLGIFIRDRQNRYFGKGWSVLAGEPLGPFNRSVTRCERVTGVEGHIEYRAPLYAILILECAFGIHIPLKIAVFSGVGIDDTADGALFCRHLGLDAPPGTIVTGDDDFSFHIYAQFFQFLVIGRNAEVDEHQFRSDISVDGEAIVRGQHFIRLSTVGIAGHRWFLQSGAVGGGFQQLQQPQLGGRE